MAFSIDILIQRFFDSKLCGIKKGHNKLLKIKLLNIVLLNVVCRFSLKFEDVSN